MPEETTILDYSNRSTEEILTIITQSAKELRQRAVEQTYADETLRGGIRPTRPNPNL